MTTEIQSVMLKRSKFKNVKNGMKWIKKNKFKPIKRVHKTNNYFRYRLNQPNKYNKFRIKTINNNVKFVIGIF